MVRVVVLSALLLFGAIDAWSGISEAEYRERRARLLAAADTDAALVFGSAPARMRNSDANYPYRQESNLLYLTGINEGGLSLVMVPHGVEVDGRRATILLFCGAGIGGELTAHGVLSEGIVLSAERFAALFSAILSGVRTLYLSSPDIGFVNDWLNDRPLFLDQEFRKQLQLKHAGLKIRNAASLVARLRECKSPAEIQLIREAIRVTGDGIRRALSVCRPGRKEYELQAAVEYEMIRQGAEHVSFPSIIGSGENSLILHYDKNRRAMNTGEVVVLDVGAEMEGYASDITRTLPVAGVFTPAQKRLYATVLKAQAAVIGMIRPGVRWSAIESAARGVIAAAGFGKYMPHGVSHHLGLDVHDVGSMDTLRAGMVITVEPGIYIPKSDTVVTPQERGFGIRVEDDVLVTETGATVLSSDIPKDPATIERLMKTPRGH